MWILLTQFNDFDQHGGYFAGSFDTYELGKASVDHLGRLGSEYKWYELIEVKHNTFANLTD